MPFEVLGELVDLPGAAEPPALLALGNVRFWPLVASPPDEARNLHLGEQAAIGVALTMPGAWIIIDEKDGRRVARAMGLRVVGTLGILVEAKRNGLIDKLGPLLMELRRKRFHLGVELIQAVLRSVGEL